MSTQLEQSPQDMIEYTMRQKISFHLLFEHNFFDPTNIPDYLIGYTNVIRMYLQMILQGDCSHTDSEIFS